MFGDKEMKGDDGKNYLLRITPKTLYLTQKGLKCKGMLDLLERFKQIDFECIYTLLSNSIVSENKLTAEELMDHNINLQEYVEFIDNSLNKMLANNEKGEDETPKK